MLVLLKPNRKNALMGYCKWNHSEVLKKPDSLIAILFLFPSSLQAAIAVGAAAAAASTARTGRAGRRAAWTTWRPGPAPTPPSLFPSSLHCAKALTSTSTRPWRRPTFIAYSTEDGLRHDVPAVSCLLWRDSAVQIWYFNLWCFKKLHKNMPVGFSVYIWNNRLTGSCLLVVLLHYCNFKGALKQFFIGFFWGWGSNPCRGNGMRKSHLRVESIVCPVQIDFQICQLEILLYVKRPFKNAGSSIF